MDTWICAICGTENLMTNYICVNCGFDQDDTTAWLEQTKKDNN